VNKIEAVGPMDPFGFDIVDFEVKVGWYVVGLRWGEIVSDNRGAWESICHVATIMSVQSQITVTHP
jgi:hypothetical protein